MPDVLRRTYRWLARADVAAVFIALVITLTVIGSLFPLPQHLFRSPPFVGLLALLMLAALACTLNRWPALWRDALRRPGRPDNGLLDAAPHVATFHAAPVADLPGRVRRCLRDRSFVITAEAGDSSYLRGDRNSLARLGTLVDHLGVILLFMGAATSSALGWRAALTLAPGQAATVPGSALTVRNDDFTILRYPDGSPASYEAQLSITDARRTISGRVAVNRPLAIRGVHLYLSGYQPTAAGDAVTILAVNDPGYGLVVAGGILMLLGLTLAIAFPHCSVHARIDADGTLRLAGFADRGAVRFGHEFTGLASVLDKTTLSGP